MAERDELLARVEPRWDSAREQRVWARLREAELGARPRRARWRWSLALATAGAAAGIVAVVLALSPRPDGPSRAREAVVGVEPAAEDVDTLADAGPLVLADGSRMWPGEAARYRLARVDAEQVEVELAAGRLRFDVRPDPRRAFRVRAGGVTVEVVGTAFSVARTPDRVEVAVSRGQVRVAAFGRPAVMLTAGDRLELELDAGEDRPEAAVALGEPEPAVAEPSAPASSPARAKPDAEPGRGPSRAALRWRGLSEAGQLDEAWAALAADGFVDRRDPEALMAAADVARLSKHPKAALRWLKIVVDEHPRSPLAPLAAFTRGRLLIEQLGDPAGAAQAFAAAVALDPRGPLVEDARAREVEALAKAGERSEAKAKAEAYLAQHPAGARRRAVERWGGLD